MEHYNMELEYNTELEHLAMPEYGRNILRMVERLKEIPEKEKRSEQARSVIKAMEILNPQMKSLEDGEHKLWDHLFMIAGFDLDIDAPYPCPLKEHFETAPEPIEFDSSRVKAAHYGRNIEKIINLLRDEPDGEVRTAMIRSLGVYMRQQYLIWNKDSVSDETIFNDIRKLSDYRLDIPEGLSLGRISPESNFAKPGLGISQTPQKNKNQRKNFRRKKR